MAMTKAFFFLNILLVFGFFAASNSWSDAKRSEPLNANWIADGLLNSFRHKVDPFYLPEINETFIQTSSAICGLSRLERTGDALGHMVDPPPTMLISIPVGVSNLQLQVNYSMDFGFPYRPFSGIIEGVISRLEVVVQVKYNILTGAKFPEDFSIVHLGSMRITEFTGLTEVWNGFIKFVMNLLLETPKEMVKSLSKNAAFKLIRML